MDISPKRISALELCAIVSSIFSLILGILFFSLPLLGILKAQYLTLFFVAQNAVIIVALILLSGYFIRAAALRATALKEWEINRFEIPKSIHSYIHQMRDFFSEESKHNYIPEKSYIQLVMACNSCKDIFDRITKVENVVTIKMISEKGESFVTIARDQLGLNSRGKGQYHKISENTEFAHLSMKDRIISKYFLNNALHFLDNYSNTNSNWREQYTSTLIVPIRKEDILVGCLSVDCKIDQNCKSGNSRAKDIIEIYNSRNHVQLLAIFADLLYCIISKTIVNTEKKV